MRSVYRLRLTDRILWHKVWFDVQYHPSHIHGLLLQYTEWRIAHVKRLLEHDSAERSHCPVEAEVDCRRDEVGNVVKGSSGSNSRAKNEVS
jgi:hypothetical protein